MTHWQVCHQSGRVLFTTHNEVTARNREQFGWKVIEVDKSREQFEAYYAEYFGQSLQWVIDRRCENKDFSGYQMGTGLQSAWKMWQASRAAIEIELPDSTEFDGPDMSGAQQAIRQIREILTETGIKVKS